MKILYIGNKLSAHGLNQTSVETLGELLAEFADIKTISDKKYKFLRILDIVFELLLNGRNYNFVLVDTYSTSAFYFALISAVICKFLKIKYIPILRGGDLKNRLSKNIFLSKIIFQNSFKNVAPSLFLKEIFNNYGFNCVLIPNNIVLDNYEFQNRSKILKPKLLWVRAFSEIYNPQMAIKVLFVLMKDYPRAELCMVGPDKDGSLDKCIKLSKDLDIEDNIKFTGQLSKKEWIEISKKYSIFLNTTNYDNMPISVMEIMALGLPIVSTDVGGVTHLLKHDIDGLLVDKNDINSMADSISNILNNKGLAEKLSINSRKS